MIVSGMKSVIKTKQYYREVSTPTLILCSVFLPILGQNGDSTSKHIKLHKDLWFNWHIGFISFICQIWFDKGQKQSACSCRLCFIGSASWGVSCKPADSGWIRPMGWGSTLIYKSIYRHICFLPFTHIYLLL